MKVVNTTKDNRKKWTVHPNALDELTLLSADYVCTYSKYMKCTYEKSMEINGQR